MLCCQHLSERDVFMYDQEVTAKVSIGLALYDPRVLDFESMLFFPVDREESEADSIASRKKLTLAELIPRCLAPNRPWSSLYLISPAPKQRSFGERQTHIMGLDLLKRVQAYLEPLMFLAVAAYGLQ